MKKHTYLYHQRGLIGLLPIFFVMSCASTKVERASKYTGQLPRPDRILVYDFSVSPEDVKLDKGLSPEITRLTKGTSRTEEELKVGREVADALSKELVKEIQSLGLPAERFGVESISYRGNIMRIEGQLLSIDEGNRTERTMIGLGAGRSEVDAHVQVYETTP